jgi:NAD dependent epimerase/dehydratase
MTQASDSIDGKRVLVTGADGFIGSHLVERLIEDGAQVRAYVYYNSWNELGWLRDISPSSLTQIEIVNGDIRDTERVAEAVRGCEYVFHLSSLIAIPYSYQAARSYVDTNVLGALNVLQACRDSSSLIRLVHVSTSEVYGSAQQVPIPETHPLVGQSPYSASKIAADKLAESFYLSFGLPVVVARPFNTFGPRQTARAVIPTIASQLISGVPELRLGSLTPTRDFNYVTDTVGGMVALGLCSDAVGMVVNIGSGEEWSIEATAKLLMKITGRVVPIVSEVERIRPDASEVNRLLADNRLIHSLTPWRTRVRFEDGLARTADWIGRNLGRFDASSYAR